MSNTRFFLIFLFFISIDIESQELPEEFLDSLPADVAEQFEQAAEQEKDEAKINELYRLDTSQTKNEALIKILKRKLDSLELKVNNNESRNDSLKRFGADFFSSSQSTFMPINVANFGDDYIVDVGDEFLLQLIGLENSELELTVERDGSLLIPEYGKVFIAGTSLKDTIEAIKTFFKTKSVGVEPIISLASLRDIQVLIIGGIEQPGMYTLSGGASILHAINVAGGITTKGSFRKIDLIRNNEMIASLDLYDMIVFGRNIFSQTLRSGDTVKIHASSFLVPVSGGIANEGLYELKKGETLQNLVEFAGGVGPSFIGSESIYIRRFDALGETFIPVNESAYSSTELYARDAVVLPFFAEDVMKVKSVKVSGMVERPGTYAINDGATISSVLKQALGLKPNGYSFGGILLRKNAKLLQDEYSQKVYANTINEIISNAAAGGGTIGADSLNLLLEEQKAQKNLGRVITEFNLVTLESNPALDILVLDGDEIFIPTLTKQVYLFGDFNQPSILPYNPNYQLKDYVRLVAGKKESSKNHFIIIDPDGTSHYVENSNWLSFKNNADIYPGSIIYMPRNIGKVKGLQFAATVSPILSSLAISLASLNSISD
jgi:protein involved in polysaccharide export with SLBB domain